MYDYACILFYRTFTAVDQKITLKKKPLMRRKMTNVTTVVIAVPLLLVTTHMALTDGDISDSGVGDGDGSGICRPLTGLPIARTMMNSSHNKSR